MPDGLRRCGRGAAGEPGEFVSLSKFYERDGIVIYCDNCLEVMPQLEGSFDGVITDPPYFKVLPDDWDNQWATQDEFLIWLKGTLAEYRRLLAFNGSLYVFCSWNLAAFVELAVREKFHVLNHIIWRKSSTRAFKNNKDIIRSFIPTTDHIIFAEHYGADNAAKGESGWGAKCDELRGFVFEPLRAYLAGEWKRAGLKFEQANEACGTASMAGGHFFSRSQWCLPTAAHYESLQRYANRDGGEYLRREYEDLRRFFSTSTDEQFSDFFDFNTAHQSECVRFAP